jgi:hypothetical protein
VRNATKEGAIAAVKEELEKVVASQPVHVECPAVLAAASAFINALTHDPQKAVAINVSGSVSWSGTNPRVIASVQTNIYAALVDPG